MAETIKPDPAEPADAGGEDTPKPQRGDSFLAPDDADETGASGGGDEPEKPKDPLPPD